MTDLKINYFSNDIYKVLKIIFDNLVTVKGDLIAPLTQQDIADLANFSKVKTNQILNDLIIRGFADTYQPKRGKYTISTKGLDIIKVMEELV